MGMVSRHLEKVCREPGCRFCQWVVSYIAGFSVRYIKRRESCSACKDVIQHREADPCKDLGFFKQKSFKQDWVEKHDGRAGLAIPSQSVVELLLAADKVICQNKYNLSDGNFQVCLLPLQI